MLAALDDPWSRRCVEAERAFLVELGGDCDLPAGAHAEPDGDDLVLRAVLADDAGLRRLVLEGTDGPELGAEAAVRLRGGEGSG